MKYQEWVIWSNEHNAWWGPNECGYFTDIEQAGRYTEKDAYDICESANIAVSGTPNEIAIPDPILFRGQSQIIDSLVAQRDEAVRLLREGLDCPFEADPAKWDAWCAQWAPRAKAWLEKAAS